MTDPDPRGTLSGDDPAPATLLRGTLSGDEPPGGGGDPRHTISGTLSGDEPPPRGTLSGEGDAPGIAVEEDPPPIEPGCHVALTGAGELLLEGELGRGSRAVVREARQTLLGRSVAVRTLLPGGAEEALLAEARLLGGLQHPGIPPVHGVGRDASGRPALVMRAARGVAWARLLAPATAEERTRAAACDLREHLRILGRACDAAGYLHARGVAHGDLRPERVLVGAFGEVLLVSFGRAASFEGGAAGGPAQDLRALGQALEAVLASPAGRQAPPELAEIAARARSADAARGFADAAALARALDEVQQHEAATRLARAALETLAGAEREASSGAVAEGAAGLTFGLFSDAVAGLARARSLWPAGRIASEGLVRARAAFARFAIARGDLALARAQVAQLEEGAPGLAALRADLALAERRAEAVLARRRRLRALLIPAVIVALVASGLGVAQSLRARRAVGDNERRAAALAVVRDAGWKEPDERAAIYARALAIDPAWKEGWVEQGASWTKYGLEVRDDPRDAEAALVSATASLDRAIALDAGYVSAIYYRGYTKQQRGLSAEALVDLREAARLGPKEHDGHAARTVMALSEGRPADAEAAATAALERAGDEDDYARRAIARYARGDVAGALEDLKASEAYLAAEEDYCGMGALYLLALGRRVEAERRIVAGLRKYARTPHVLPLVAWLAAARGEAVSARAALERARAETAAYARCFLDRDLVNVALARAEGERGLLGKAFLGEADLALAAPATPPPALALLARGEALLGEGRAEQALALAEQALAAAPADGRARLLAGRALALLGHADAARHELSVVAALAPDRAQDAATTLAALERPAGGAR